MSRKTKFVEIKAESVFHTLVKPEQNQKTISSEYTRVEARTENQRLMIKSILQNPLTIANGLAGTGKTSCAVGIAVQLLKTHRVSKIYISRPAVPVYEEIGHLPGDMSEKMGPYVAPMRGEFNKYLPIGEFDKFLKNGTIEIIPLAYLQGFNIEDAILLVDEAGLLQYKQFSLIFTRLCQTGKIVIMGDPLQDGDLGTGEDFERVCNKLEGMEGIGVIHFSAQDNQRHEIINRVLRRLNGASSRAPLPLEGRLDYEEEHEFGKEYLSLYD